MVVRIVFNALRAEIKTTKLLERNSSTSWVLSSLPGIFEGRWRQSLKQPVTGRWLGGYKAYALCISDRKAQAGLRPGPAGSPPEKWGTGGRTATIGVIDGKEGMREE